MADDKDEEDNDDNRFFNLKSDDWSAFIDTFEKDGSKVTKNVRMEHLELGPNNGLKEGKHAFVLYDTLTDDECAWLIAQTEKMGYSKMPEYPTHYRSNTRVMSAQERLAEAIYNRVKIHIPQVIEPYVKGQTWTAIGLNERFRFCRYASGQHFSAHFDAPFRRKGDEHSFLTFMIYLNDVNTGGETNFLLEGYDASDPDRIIKSLPPKRGSILVFTHKIWHEGARLDSGLKYLMRSEVMYKMNTVVEEDTENTASDVEQRVRLLLTKY